MYKFASSHDIMGGTHTNTVGCIVYKHKQPSIFSLLSLFSSPSLLLCAINYVFLSYLPVSPRPLICPLPLVSHSQVRYTITLPPTTMTEWWSDPDTVRVLYALTVSHGIVGKLSPQVAESSKAGTLGVLVTPSLYPVDQFTLAQDLQPAFNSLIHSVSNCHEFLASTLEK